MLFNVFLAVAIATSAVIAQNTTETTPFQCSAANGTAPDSTDSTCQRYWSCDNFTLSLRTCAEGQAYNWTVSTCVSESVACEFQNEVFNETISNQTALSRQRRAANYSTPSFKATGGTNNTTEVSVEKLEPITVTLGKQICAHIGNNIQNVERVTNNAVHLFTHCVFHRCDVEQIKFVCP